ncbi:MAG: helix-turn-helix transcriptional regulator [Cyanobacteria bacterium SBLK]|nr:helix-turn-helix transcriptional regulator [Cyanobacteria bacterium SBLK]
MAEKDPPLTQKALASATKLSTTTINQLYGNKFKRLDAHTIETLCNFFEIDVGDLLTMEEMPDEEDS